MIANRLASSKIERDRANRFLCLKRSVLFDQPQTGVLEPFAEPGGEFAVEFNGGNLRTGFEQQFRQGAEARTDFQNAVGRLNVGGADNAFREIGVHQKILSELLAGSNAQTFHQSCKLFLIHDVQ